MAKRGRKKGAKGIDSRKQKGMRDESVIPDTLSNEIHTAHHQYLVSRIFSYLMDGKMFNDIRALIAQEDSSITDAQFIAFFDAAMSNVEIAIHRDREYMFALHLDRYERIYEQCMRLENKYGFKHNPNKEVARIANDYKNALIALKCKEDLIGLHNRKLVLEINQNQAYLVDKDEATLGTGIMPDIDLDQLSISELKELLQLIQEARTVPEILGIQRVVVKQKTVIEVNGNIEIVEEKRNIDSVHPVQDITFEEMPEKVIHRIEDTTPKDPEPEVIKEVIEDLTHKGIVGKSPEDLMESIQQKHLEELKRKMKGL